MRIFKNYLEACKEIERDLWELGAICKTKSVQDQIGEFETRELIGYQFSVPSIGAVVDLPEFFSFDKRTFIDYIGKETGERWDGIRNPGTSWEVRRKEWEQYLFDGKFAYTYPERIWDPTNQFGHIIQVLRNDPYSRQAIVQIYDKHRDYPNTGGRARIPCSLTYQYLCRSSDEFLRLHCLYTMRSCDFYKHFPYDMCIAGALNNWLAHKLEWKPGNLIMQIGSLHAFKTDLDKRKIF